MPFLLGDKYSFLNGSKLYARAGTEINIIEDRGGVFIVQPIGGGEKFPLLQNEFSNERVDKNRIAADSDPGAAAPKASTGRRPTQGKAGARSGASAETGQKSLF